MRKASCLKKFQIKSCILLRIEDNKYLIWDLPDDGEDGHEINKIMEEMNKKEFIKIQ